LVSISFVSFRSFMCVLHLRMFNYYCITRIAHCEIRSQRANVQSISFTLGVFFCIP